MLSPFGTLSPLVYPLEVGRTHGYAYSEQPIWAHSCLNQMDLPSYLPWGALPPLYGRNWTDRRIIIGWWNRNFLYASYRLAHRMQQLSNAVGSTLGWVSSFLTQSAFPLSQHARRIFCSRKDGSIIWKPGRTTKRIYPERVMDVLNYNFSSMYGG